MTRKARAGRKAMPKDEKQTIVPVRFHPDLLAAIDEEAERQLDKPGRSATIRSLCVEALIARGRLKRG